jgi:hypothetical protein
MNNLFDAFISYGRADSLAFGRKLYEQLLKVGFEIWFDQNDIPLGVDFQNQIDDGIEKAHNFLFIIAPHSVNSPYCLKEIELAIKRNKRIIPCCTSSKLVGKLGRRDSLMVRQKSGKRTKHKGNIRFFRICTRRLAKLTGCIFERKSMILRSLLQA